MITDIEKIACIENYLIIHKFQDQSNISTVKNDIYQQIHIGHDRKEIINI